MTTFEKRTRIAASPERVYAFHDQADALTRLIPPWEEMRVISKTPGLGIGTRTEVEAKIGPITQRIIAEHTRCEAGRMFQDRQVKGPFARWEHTHTMETDGAGGAWLVDTVEYELPLGLLGRLMAGAFVRAKLERLFAFRHEVTKRACEAREGA
jgi:ligand-binding SRPBCC domain-containing protein